MPINLEPGAEREFFSEMHDTQFGEWRNHPVTKAFLAYLAFQADAYRIIHLKLWEGGGSIAGKEENVSIDRELRGRIAMLDDLQDINLAVIHVAYGIEPKERDRARDERAGTAANQRPSR